MKKQKVTRRDVDEKSKFSMRLRQWHLQQQREENNEKKNPNNRQWHLVILSQITTVMDNGIFNLIILIIIIYNNDIMHYFKHQFDFQTNFIICFSNKIFGTKTPPL